MRRAILVATAVPTGILLVLGAEVLLAINGRQLEAVEPFDLSGQLGTATEGELLRVAWIGDSVSAGVGASGPEATVPRLVAAGLERPVRLDVFASSGARVRGALEEQVPRVEGLPEPPHVVVVQVGANDVIHLTDTDGFRSDYAHLLERVSATGAQHVLALGIPAFGTSPRFLQPLRALVGWRGRMLDGEIRELVADTRATYVDVAGNTGDEFGDDPDRFYAEDDFHPSDAGYALWADAVLDALDGLGVATGAAPSREP